jgi:hypothetical protein
MLQGEPDLDARRTLEPYRLGRLARVAVLAPLVVLALLALPSAAPAQQGLVTGFLGTQYWSSDPAERAFWLDRTLDSGAGIVRLGVEWPHFIVGSQRPPDPANPGSASYYFSSLDWAVRDIKARGLAVLLTVNHAPAWAEGPGRPANAQPGTWKPNPADLASFSQALAARYSGGFDPDGSGPAPPLPAVEGLQVWNEPNQEFFLSPAYEGTTPVSPAHYRLMLNASYQAVKAVNPQMLVVVGGTSPYGDPPGGPYPSFGARVRPVQFWRELLCVQTDGCPGPALFDIFAHHPIDNTGAGPLRSAPDPNDASTPDLGRVVNVLRAAEQAGTTLPGSHPVWVTEFWWDSNPPNPVGAPLDVQAAWIEQSLYLFWKAGASAAINFSIGDSTVFPDTRNGFQSGPYFIDGQPKPSLTAFRFPFVTERIDTQTLRAWGKAPKSGTLNVEQRQKSRWVTIKQLQVSKGAVFLTELRLSGNAALRATMKGSKSLVWQQS